MCEYWNRPEAARQAFVHGWLRTGDVAVLDSDGYYRIMGRQSVDIIKSGGYKLSALEIQATLFAHPEIEQCAVVGLPDETRDKIVVAAVVCHTASLKSGRDRMSPFKIPKQVLVVDELQRNAMGKILKPAVRNLLL